MLEFFGLFELGGWLLRLEGEYLVTGKALLLEVAFLVMLGILDLRDLRKPSWGKRF